MKPDFINEMYRWALECMKFSNADHLLNKIMEMLYLILIFYWVLCTAVAVVGLNTRLGCLDPNLNPDSEAQKMINAANTSFTTSNKLEFGLPFWRFFKTPMCLNSYTRLKTFSLRIIT